MHGALKQSFAGGLGALPVRTDCVLLSARPSSAPAQTLSYQNYGTVSTRDSRPILPPSYIRVFVFHELAHDDSLATIVVYRYYYSMMHHVQSIC